MLAHGEDELRHHSKHEAKSPSTDTPAPTAPGPISRKSFFETPGGAPTTVSQAVALAAERTSNLTYLTGALVSAAATPFRQPARVLQALLAIDAVATNWLKSLETGKSAGPLREQFRQAGFIYSADVSVTSKTSWASEYIAQYKGRSVPIGPHITLGAGSPATCLSIHFAWCAEDKTVLIAHVGRHKPNTLA